MKRDRFELLSAYLDGEVTAEERRLVESWLDQDSTVQQLYQRLLRLRQAMQACPIPESDESSVEATIQQVFDRVDRRPRRLALLGGGAIAAMVVGAVSLLLVGPESRVFQFAQSPEPELASEGLQIALDQPVIEIPKAPSAASSLESPSLYQPNSDIR